MWATFSFICYFISCLFRNVYRFFAQVLLDCLVLFIFLFCVSFWYMSDEHLQLHDSLYSAPGSILCSFRLFCSVTTACVPSFSLPRAGPRPPASHVSLSSWRPGPVWGQPHGTVSRAFLGGGQASWHGKWCLGFLS